MKVIEGDAERFQIFVLLGRDALDEFLGRYPLLSRRYHDRCAVRVCGADISAIMAALFLESRPNIGLHVLDHMAHVERTIGVR
jgi:hypothetical protein